MYFIRTGKLKLATLIQKKKDLLGAVSIFHNKEATVGEVAAAGEDVIRALYGAPHSERHLNDY